MWIQSTFSRHRFQFIWVFFVIFCLFFEWQKEEGDNLNNKCLKCSNFIWSMVYYRHAWDIAHAHTKLIWAKYTFTFIAVAYRNSPNNAISLFSSDTLCILWHNSKAGVALFSVFGSHLTESSDFIGRVALCIGAWIGATCWLILYASYLMSHASFLRTTIVSW